MFGYNKAGCERQLPKSKPKNNTTTKENVGNGEKRYVQQWKRKETKSTENIGSAELSSIVISSSTPQQVLSQRVVDSGNNSLPAHGSQGRPSTTIVSNQGNRFRFAALANDTTDVDVQPSATILGDCNCCRNRR
ncbi:hypothetical protein IFM89_036660 [Coptis chinensis]|uniref:Uncharacterized protein n=1 Tax=Coptis chinensis TaxID=261450 RepID=A0A835I8X0_9MAGN|nr:hypothetical protein IFM89_036660 [Coptis chinensis]